MALSRRKSQSIHNDKGNWDLILAFGERGTEPENCVRKVLCVQQDIRAIEANKIYEQTRIKKVKFIRKITEKLSLWNVGMMIHKSRCQCYFMDLAKVTDDRQKLIFA